MSFLSLVEIEMMLYAVIHSLFLLAFVALRVQRPDAERPFRLPGGTPAAVCYCVPPFLICLATLGANLYIPRHAAAFGIALAIGLVGHLASYGLQMCCQRRWAAQANAAGESEAAVRWRDAQDGNGYYETAPE
jgi:amino acid transporter